MFHQHQPTIGAWARKSPAHFARVGLMCLLSARQPFDRLRHDVQDVLAGNNRPLWGWKAAAWADMSDFAEERLKQLLHLQAYAADDAALLYQVAQWHGLGFVKGGFLLQLVFGRAGCLDVRNADDFGIGRIRDPDIARRPRAARRHAERYVDLCDSLGGAEFLWDHWCTAYSTTSARLTTPWAVSAEHCHILGLDPGPMDTPF